MCLVFLPVSCVGCVYVSEPCNRHTSCDCAWRHLIDHYKRSIGVLMWLYHARCIVMSSRIWICEVVCICVTLTGNHPVEASQRGTLLVATTLTCIEISSFVHCTLHTHTHISHSPHPHTHSSSAPPDRRFSRWLRQGSQSSAVHHTKCTSSPPELYSTLRKMPACYKTRRSL